MINENEIWKGKLVQLDRHKIEEVTDYSITFSYNGTTGREKSTVDKKRFLKHWEKRND